MNSEIYVIDSLASKGNSVVHRSSYITKTLFAALFLMIIIFTQNNYKLIAYIVATIALMFVAKLPVKKLITWSIYPLIFGLMFAVSQAFFSYHMAITTMLRVFSTVLLMLFFITTTRFAQIFNLIPSQTLKNTFLLTYRFFFMIIDSISQRMKIMGIRGLNQAKLGRRMNAFSSFIAHSLLHTIEKAERVYKIMMIRGYSGKIGIVADGMNKCDLFFIFPLAMVVWICFA